MDVSLPWPGLRLGQIHTVKVVVAYHAVFRIACHIYCLQTQSGGNKKDLRQQYRTAHLIRQWLYGFVLLSSYPIHVHRVINLYPTDSLQDFALNQMSDKVLPCTCFAKIQEAPTEKEDGS